MILFDQIVQRGSKLVRLTSSKATGRKDFKVPKRVSGGFLKKGIVRFDMDRLPFKATLSNGRTKAAPPEYSISGSLVSEPWPLSHVLVKGITDSMSSVQ